MLQSVFSFCTWEKHTDFKSVIDDSKLQCWNKLGENNQLHDVDCCGKTVIIPFLYVWFRNDISKTVNLITISIPLLRAMFMVAWRPCVKEIPIRKRDESVASVGTMAMGHGLISAKVSVIEVTFRIRSSLS